MTETPKAATRRKRAGYSTIIAVIVGLGALLVVQSSFSSGRYSLDIAAIKAEPHRFVGREVKIVGKIKEGTTENVTRGSTQELRFVIHDGLGNELPVAYPHLPPDPYKEGRECIVEGIMGKDGTIQCTKLTVKCPSKYQTEGGTHPGDEQDPGYEKKYGPARPASGPTS